MRGILSLGLIPAARGFVKAAEVIGDEASKKLRQQQLDALVTEADELERQGRLRHQPKRPLVVRRSKSPADATTTQHADVGKITQSPAWLRYTTFMLRNTKAHRRQKLPWLWLKPDYLADSVSDIDFNYLKRQGVKAIFIDLDGTVVQRNTFEVSDTIKKVLHKQPLDIYIATNRPRSRSLKNLKEDLHASGVVHPNGMWCKPFPRYFRTASRLLGLRRQDIVMIGDRYIQDVLGANSAGLKTIAVRKLGEPVNRRDRLITHIDSRRTARLSKRYREIK